MPAALPSDDPLVGSTIDSKYKLLESIGNGGMATVYRAWHLMLHKEVAVKFIHPEATYSENFRERFFREAQIASSLVHRNIVQTRDFGETADGMFYILMDFCPGSTLADVIDRTGPLDPARAAKIICQALSALQEAHEMGVVHRDIKAENVMVDEESDDLSRLLDFGLAKIAGVEGDGAGANLTRAGAVLGTPKYMSPEQALGQPCDHRSDLYSVGILLYETLAGRLPYKASSSSELIRLQIVEVPKRPTEVVPGLEVPENLEAIVMKAVAKEKESRWQSAQEFRAALEAFLQGEQVDADLPLTPDAFEHRGALGLSGLVAGDQVDRVFHKEREEEGLLWIFSVERLRRDTLAGFVNQVGLSQRVQHPALVSPSEAGAYVGERLYAFCPWQEGQTLQAHLGEAPDSNAVLGALEPLVRGLAKAHQFGVTHGRICAQLVTVPAAVQHPVLHGLGVHPAAGRGGAADEDVRALALLGLELLAGASVVEVGEEAVRQAGLPKLDSKVRAVFERATGDTPQPNAEAFLKALQLVSPQFAAASGRRSRRLVPVVALLTLGLLLALFWPRLEVALRPRVTLDLHTTPGAQVELRGMDALSGVTRNLKVEGDGAFAFEGLPTGRYLVRVSKEGFADRQVVVPVDAEPSEPIDLSLASGDGQGQPAIDPEVLERLWRQVTELAERLDGAPAAERFAGGLLARAGTARARAEELRSAPPARQHELLASLELAGSLYRDVEASSRSELRSALARVRRQQERLHAELEVGDAAELASGELAQIDTAIEAASALEGVEQLDAMAAAVESLRGLGELVADRAELQRLTKQKDALQLEVETLRREALEAGAARSAETVFQEAERLRDRAEAMAVPAPAEVEADRISTARATLSVAIRTWRSARGRYEAAVAVAAAAGAQPRSLGGLQDSLRMLSNLANERNADLAAVLTRAKEQGWDWRAHADLGDRVEAARQAFGGLQDKALMLVEAAEASPTEVERVSQALSGAVKTLRELTEALAEGLRAHAALKSRLDGRLRLVSRWQAELRGEELPPAARDDQRSAEADLARAESARREGRLQEALDAYAAAIRSYAAAAEIVRDHKTVATVLLRLKSAVRRKSASRLESLYVDFATDRTFFNSFFDRAASVEIEFGDVQVEGDRANVPVEEFTYVDRLRDTRVSMDGYRVALRRVEGDWRVVEVGRK